MWIDDQVLRRCQEPLACEVFVPDRAVVVLGSSNQIATEVDAEACAIDHVEILKRYGGGGTVLLYPGCVVVSIGTWVRRPYENKHYFSLLNGALIATLSSLGASGLAQNGLSDIVLGDRKVAGTSLFRSRSYLLYQASLLVDLDGEAIARYLRHPSREPDYRRGRSHAEFLVGLAEIIAGSTAGILAEGIKGALPDTLREHLRDEFVTPVAAQFPHLQARVAGAFS